MAAWPYNTAAWQRLRRVKLMQDPLCEYCPTDHRALGTEVDHKQAIEKGGCPWSMSNLASTCKPCHSKKTQYVDVQGRESVPVKGVDPKTGKPLDPAHWWNKS